MIVCVCGGVSDREIRGAIARGADSLGDLARACRAGADCGCCREQLVVMLTEHRLGRTGDATRQPNARTTSA